MHGGKQIHGAHLGPAKKQPPDGKHNLAKKIQKVRDLGRKSQHAFAHAGHKARIGFAAFGTCLGRNRKGQLDEALEAFGQFRMHRQLTGACRLDHLHQKNQEGAVPLA